MADFAADHAIAGRGTPSPNWRDIDKQQLLEAVWDQVAKADDRYDDIGGDDVLVDQLGRMMDSDIAIAENGDIYVAVENDPPTGGSEIRIYRSTDTGTNFSLWGRLYGSVSGDYYMEPSILACEGVENRLYVAYKRYVSGSSDSEIRLVHAELADASAVFSAEVTVLAATDVDFSEPRLASDNASWNAYYLYLVATGEQEPGGDDIWFSRSIDRGTSFETGYQIAWLSVTDRNYGSPDICYGLDGWLHVVWHFRFLDHSYDASVRYRRVPDYANGGSASWENMVVLTSHLSDMDEINPRVAACQTSPHVAVGYRRYEWNSTGGYYSVRNSGFRGSDDYGATWGAETVTTGTTDRVMDLEYQPSTDDFVALGMGATSLGLRRAAASDLTDWSTYLQFCDQSAYTGTVWSSGLGIDPSHDDRLATSWSAGTYAEQPNSYYFDAEWRADPGYPNVEDGFPLDLPAEPISPPALVDLNGDGRLEIVFSDEENRIQAIQYDGTSLNGWPVTVPASLSDCPVAVGAMTLGEDLSVLVGTTEGEIYGYDQNGAPLDGFPYVFPDEEPAYVAIGAMGGPYPRIAVACAGPRTRYFNHRGEHIAGAVVGWFVSGATFNTSPAIGDIDGDGEAEAVFAGGDRLLATDLHTYVTEINMGLPDNVTDAVSLGDVDLDGACEIFVPCRDGGMYQFDGDGNTVTGWPVMTGAALPMTSAAIAQVLYGYEPDIVWGHEQWAVYGCYHDGTALPNYPVYTTLGWGVRGAPILSDIDDNIGETIFGEQGYKIHAWDSGGLTADGWPRYVGQQIELSPATGDIDQDGSAEVVFLSRSSVLVYDVNFPLDSPHFIWPMYGYDPQRTGCHNCAEDLTTAVDDELDGLAGPTRVSLAAPAPNPTSGPTLFTFAIPVRSQVRLEIFDVRGRRIRSVLREESVPGVHTCQWDGRDRAGRPLASGVYFATLQVRGPGVDQTLSRKVNLLR